MASKWGANYRVIAEIHKGNVQRIKMETNSDLTSVIW